MMQEIRHVIGNTKISIYRSLLEKDQHIKASNLLNTAKIIHKTKTHLDQARKIN